MKYSKIKKIYFELNIDKRLNKYYNEGDEAI